MDKFQNNEGVFINYTQVQNVVQDKFNLAPRKQFCGAKAGSDWTDDDLLEIYKNQGSDVEKAKFLLN